MGETERHVAVSRDHGIEPLPVSAHHDYCGGDTADTTAVTSNVNSRRRACLLGGLSSVSSLVLASCATMSGPTLPPAKLSGMTLDPRADDSGRLIEPPPSDYWPYSGTSGPGRAPTPASIGQGWTSDLPNVRYAGPDTPRYPVAPWGDSASGRMVREGLLPALRPIHHVHIRDTIVQPSLDGWYYMTGSTGDNIWAKNDGVELWRSRDLDHWEYRGLVWSIERDGGWERSWRMRRGVAFRALWAPEIHFINGQWLICHSMSRGGIAILKSVSGAAEGPYIHAFSADRPIRSGIDATLFRDDDGSVWLTLGAANEIVRLRDDFSGLAGQWRPVKVSGYDLNPKHHRAQCADIGFRHLGYEGATLFKRAGRYYLGVVDRYYGRYSFAMWTADHIDGPYGDRHELPGCGGGNFFQDHEQRWWVTFFGNDDQSPFREMPGLARVEFDGAGRVVFAQEQPFATQPFVR